MFENIKFGLHAELLHNRGFEEAANVIGLPRHWERDPDDRNDDAIRFAWDDSGRIRRRVRPGQHQVEHALRIDVTAQDGQPPRHPSGPRAGARRASSTAARCGCGRGTSPGV